MALPQQTASIFSTRNGLFKFKSYPSPSFIASIASRGFDCAVPPS